MSRSASANRERLEQGGQVYGLASHCQALCVHPDVSQAFWRLSQLVKNPGVMWLLLAGWIDRRRPTTEKRALIDDADRLFDRLLGAYRNQGWAPGRLPVHRFTNKLANEIDALVRQARRAPQP